MDGIHVLIFRVKYEVDGNVMNNVGLRWYGFHIPVMNKKYSSNDSIFINFGYKTPKQHIWKMRWSNANQVNLFQFSNYNVSEYKILENDKRDHSKEVCNWGHGFRVSCHQARNPGAQVLAVWSQTDLQPVKQNLCLAPDQEMVLPKKVANDLKINLAP